VVPSVPSGVAVTVVAVASLIPLSGFLTIAFGARAAGLAGWPRLAGYVAAGLLAWGGLGVALAALEIGWGAAYRLTPVLLALAYALPVLLVVAALRRAPRLPPRPADDAALRDGGDRAGVRAAVDFRL